MALQDDVRNLAANPMLANLEPDALRLIAFSAETRILRAGDVLFRRGDASDGGYVVLSGAVVLDAGSGEPAIARPPALIGGNALISQTMRPCTASAREPSSVFKISRALFHRVLSEYPDGAARLRQSLGREMLDLRDELARYRQTVI